MHLIVAEKNISARRIAEILGEGKKITEHRDAGVSTYSYGDTTTVGLRGHVVEIDFEPGYSNWRSEQYTPRSLIDAKTIKVPTEKKIVALLQKLAKKADRVTIATDFDTEGELIGKEAYELIRAVNKNVPIDRARFSAITKGELRHAFSKTAELDFALAAAGEARQSIDLMWGASLTRFISLAAKRGGANILSVGRVQSPTLTMIVDREKEIEAFVPEKYWQLGLETEKRGETIEARHTHGRFHDKAEAEAARDRTKDPLVVTEVREGTKQDRAPSPFDTTTYIVAAARLGFSAANAMRIAEDLYMNGFISYPRTDNTVYPASLDINGILKTLLSSPFRKDVEWIQKNRRAEPTRGKKSTTDHPPIHPTGAATREQLGDDAFRIYELVLRRFLATLAPDAQWKTLKILFVAGGEEYTTTGGQLLEPGWHAVYPFSEAKEVILPAFATGEKLPVKKVTLDEKETQPPARYTQSKLIQRMEELGLGTKSTRHEVIAKLVSRKYVEGNPLRPTLVGRVVTESLEQHADTVTKPDMTRTLEDHMQQIKKSERTREDVIRESREMLHKAFDQLEANEQVIGDDIRNRTAEEMNLGKCPVCGGTLAIRHMRGNTQFIGCSRYPECTFNIGLPMAQWGFAVRIDEICEKHGLNFVRLVRKGARPWDIGCPLCHHIESNRESLAAMPSMTPALSEKLQKQHIYTVAELARSTPEDLAKRLGLMVSEAAQVVADAGTMLEKLRKRSECRKFLRDRLIPRKGRSYAKIMDCLKAQGITELAGLAKADVSALKTAGIGDTEAEQVLAEAKSVYYGQVLREMGIPAVSLKKYLAAGFITPDAFCDLKPETLSERTGMSLGTVQKHVEMVCKALGKQAPKKVAKTQTERGRKELLTIKGVTEQIAGKLILAGVTDGKTLAAADPAAVAKETGIPVQKVRDFQAIFRKKKEIIQL
ncbi:MULTISPECIES: DNA topoisomerase I [unclassified Methanoregula]|uniref:DNA topoisomerase I n=1 Tax=unclassified Methanoregula TaxID=2649730 RepID=UPI0009C6F817|nr:MULTISPECIES: DNA topoisomerase I [unclassified Methanoregula]OPX62918.1 MAG: Reverse gyrase 1 [Methanoregula sp. PtaB.Bin085]OPY35131.1 MAG: Reverse gyrase 1 [Methanoregula sp. PtaU1.Bin006]